jgi:hypothetical protein
MKPEYHEGPKARKTFGNYIGQHCGKLAVI